MTTTPHPEVTAPPADAVNGDKTTLTSAKPEVLPPAVVMGLPRVIVTLDETIGSETSKRGQLVQTTVVSAQEGSQPILPLGTKVILRVDRLGSTAGGSLGTITLSVRSLVGNDSAEQRVDARVLSAELVDSHPGGRPVNATGAPSGDVVGSVIPASEIPPGDFSRDPLQKGTVISLGTGASRHQLDKGSRLAIEFRGAVVAERPELHELGDIYAEADESTLIGRAVVLDGVPVESVIGDVVFWIGTSPEHRTLVVMDKAIDTPETAIQVHKGDRVTISAIFEKMPSAKEAPHLWLLVTKKDAAEITGHPAYLFAYRAKVVMTKHHDK